MLTPEYLAGLPEPIIELYAEAERAILADMARKISAYNYWIPATDWQYQKLMDAGRTEEEIIRILSAYTKRTEEELRELMQQAASECLRDDMTTYEWAGIRVPSPAESESLIKILKQGYAQTLGTMRNITRTTAKTASGQFERALDIAWAKVQSGAFSYDAAITTAIKNLSRDGVQSIRYQSGRVETLEVAVRRAVVTGVNQTSGKLQVELARELGSDLMELTAHAGARPSHAEWQGKIVSLSGKKGYLSLKDIGYGSGAGFLGWNCRHSWNPYFEGAPRTWTDKELAELNAPRYEYDGKQLTRYEAEQLQRRNERMIRRYKRENAAMKAAGMDASESAAMLKKWNDEQKRFLDATGLKRQRAREQVAGAVVKKDVRISGGKFE